MLLVLVVLAFGGVTGLMFMAQRYSSLLTGRAEDEEVALLKSMIDEERTRHGIKHES